jgi:hypothetical protein
MDLVTLVLACSVYPNKSVVNAMVEINSQNNPYMISGEPFKKESQALARVNQLKDSGASFQIGLMQIPDFWLLQKPVSTGELLRPCKNMVLATQILNKLMDDCNGSETCALSMYKTNDKTAGLDYATQVLDYANMYPFVTPPPLD